MKYTKENLPEEFTAINSADTHIHALNLGNGKFCISSDSYCEDYYYDTDSIVNCLNGLWGNIKIIKAKVLDYEIY
jgi:hypothetical protein